MVLATDESELERAARSAARMARNGATVSAIAARRSSPLSLSLGSVRITPTEPRARAIGPALRAAPPGVFDRRSWAYWHTVLEVLPTPPLPKRQFPDS